MLLVVLSRSEVRLLKYILTFLKQDTVLCLGGLESKKQ